jgi:outer membrane protein assembly factor BamB
MIVAVWTGACLDGLDPGDPAVAQLDVFASDSALLSGHSLSLRFVARDSAGNVVVPRTVLWSTSDASLATVDAAGVVSAAVGSSGGDLLVFAEAVRGGARDTLGVHVAVHGEVKWRAAIGSMPVVGGAAEGPDGTIYVLTYDDPASHSSRLHALTPRGKVKWSRLLTEVLDNIPVVAANGSVCVVGQHVWVFQPDGAVLWSLTNRPASLPSSYSGAVSAGGVLLGAMGFDLFAFDLATGDTLWQGPSTPDGSWIIPPTFAANGTTVFIKRSGDSTFARTVVTGLSKWQVADPLPGRYTYSVGVAVGDGRNYIPAAYQLLVTDASGAVLDTTTDIGCCVSEPAIGPDGSLYVQVAGNSYGLHTLDADGVERWRTTGIRPARGWYGGPALAAGGVLYAAAMDGFYSLQLSSTGATVRWRFPADTSQRLKFFGAPLIGRDGTVYSFSSTVNGQEPANATDELFAFWEDKPVEPNSPWPMWRHDARRSGQAHR